MAEAVEVKDSDGDPYYIARVENTTGEPIDLEESHDRAVSEHACSKFNKALFARGVDA